VDGGRLQIFERPPGAAAAPPKATPVERLPEPDGVMAATVVEPLPKPDVVTVATGASAAVPASPGPEPASWEAEDGKVPAAAAGVATAPAAGGEEEDEERQGKFWREDKIGLLLTLQSEASAHDPCPQIPKTFLNPAHMSQLVRELKKRAPPQEEAA